MVDFVLLHSQLRIYVTSSSKPAMFGPELKIHFNAQHYSQPTEEVSMHSVSTSQCEWACFLYVSSNKHNNNGVIRFNYVACASHLQNDAYPTARPIN